MKPLVRTMFARYLVCILSILIFTVLAIEYSKAQVGTPKTYKFVNGNWFDGNDFKKDLFYSVNGIFTKKPPNQVDEILDLQNRFVVPPFADAHNHYIASPHQIDKIIQEYLHDGIFYAKNPASISRDTALIKDKINKPDSVDVIFSGASLTASGGHPVLLYEKHLKNVKKPGPDGTFENLAYFIVDNEKDLEAKWPAFLNGHPDFIKVHLLYSEEFSKRRDDPAYYGHKGMDPELIPSIVKKAHENKLRVSCHIETAGDFRAATKAGVDEINHMPGYYPDFKHPDWFSLTEEDAELAASKNIVVVTTTYVSAAELKNADELKRAKEIQTTNLKLLHNAKIRIAIGPDVYGQTSLAEAMNLYGMKVFDNRILLKMWTETTAEAIFPTRKIGHLQEGYEASFLVLNGNPVTNFEMVKDIRLRFKQGHLLNSL